LLTYSLRDTYFYRDTIYFPARYNNMPAKEQIETVVITLQGMDTPICYPQLRVASDSTVANVRVNAQTLVGFDDATCQLILERTGQSLADSLSIKAADVRTGDTLTVLPFITTQTSAARSIPNAALSADAPSAQLPVSVPQQVSTFDGRALKVAYRLELTVLGLPNSATGERVDYIIALQDRHENDPSLFFEAYDRREYKQLASFLHDTLGREPSYSELNQIIRRWCEDILVGHRRTLFTVTA